MPDRTDLCTKYLFADNILCDMTATGNITIFPRQSDPTFTMLSGKNYSLRSSC